MAAIDITALPLLPLNTGVVLPGMLVTLALESPEASAAVEAARSADNRLVLVPRLSAGPSGQDDDDQRASGGRYARVGTVARVDTVGELPGGIAAVVVRGLHRAVIGSGVTGTGRALWVSLERAEEINGHTDLARQMAKESRLVV